MTEERLQDLARYKESSLYSEREKLVLEYTDYMTQTPVDVPEALFNKLKQHFDEPQLIELSSAIAWDNFKARLHHALDIQSEDFSQGKFCPVPVRAAETVPTTVAD